MTNLRGNVDAITNVANGKRIDLSYHYEKMLIGYVGKAKMVKWIAFKRRFSKEDFWKFHISTCTGKMYQKIVMVRLLVKNMY